MDLIFVDAHGKRGENDKPLLIASLPNPTLADVPHVGEIIVFFGAPTGPHIDSQRIYRVLQVERGYDLSYTMHRIGNREEEQVVASPLSFVRVTVELVVQQGGELERRLAEEEGA